MAKNILSLTSEGKEGNFLNGLNVRIRDTRLSFSSFFTLAKNNRWIYLQSKVFFIAVKRRCAILNTRNIFTGKSILYCNKKTRRYDILNTRSIFTGKSILYCKKREGMIFWIQEKIFTGKSIFYCKKKTKVCYFKYKKYIYWQKYSLWQKKKQRYAILNTRNMFTGKSILNCSKSEGMLF